MMAATFAKLCQRSSVGKLLPEALYVHVSAVQALEPALQAVEQLACAATVQTANATVIKFSFSQSKVVYLFYPDFDTEAHPALYSSIQINLNTLEAKERDYSTTDNPPVLHRKETFVTSSYPHYPTFVWLTQQEEALGLL